MGQEASKECLSLPTTSDPYGSDGQNVFEVGYDQLPVDSSFQTQVFSNENPQKELILPTQEFIIDILNDFISYTNTSTVDEAFMKVVVQIFNSPLDTKTKTVQILTNLMKFLRERSVPYLQSEEKRIQDIYIQYSGVQADIVNAHRKIPESKLRENFQKDSESLEKFILEFDKNIKFEAISPHISHALVTKRISSAIQSQTNVYKLLQWGFAAGEISAIIDSFVNLVNFNLEGSVKTNNFSFVPIKPTIDTISLANICFAPPTNELISSTKLSKISEIGHRQTSFIVSNGSSLFILGKQCKLTEVNLSKSITINADRFKQYTLDGINEDKNTENVLSFSNGHIVISSRNSPNYSLYETKPFKRIDGKLKFSIHGDFDSIPEFCPPFASDSKYIYALRAPEGVTVLSIESPKIIIHRFIQFSRSNAQLLDPYRSELFPNEFLSGLIATTNGISISFFKLMRSRDGDNTYFARHFSLVDGKHICDSMFSLKYALSSITYDPWNMCYWGVTQENLKVIKIPSYSSISPWLTGCDINNIAEFDINTPCNTHADVSLALLDFLEYYTAHFFGLSFHAAQSNPMYSPMIARFFAPCTNAAIDSIINAINFFINLYEESFEIGDWTVENYRRTILSLIRLLDYNLSNLDFAISAEDGKEPEKFENRIQAIKLLTSIINNEKLRFSHKLVIFAIINSIELLFDGELGMLAPVFQKITEKADSEFIFYTLQKIHNLRCYAYCFSEETIPQIFADDIKNYPNVQPTKLEMLNTYMRSLFVELRRIITSKKKKDSDVIIINSFKKFSEMIFTNISNRLSSLPETYDENTQKLTNTALFEKFFMLFNAFHSYTLIVDFGIEKLRNLYFLITKKVSSTKFTASVIPRHNLLFFNIISCYLDFIESSMNNNVSIKEITQYNWLYQPTKESTLTPEGVDKIYTESACEKTARQMLKKGLSFNIDNNIFGNVQTQENFLTSLIKKTEAKTVTQLIDFLYKKIPFKIRKKISDEERCIERFILASFSKQLGLTSDICNLNLEIVKGNEPQIPVTIKQAVQAIYKVRGTIMLAKQSNNYHADKDKTANAQNYEEFITNIKKKCIYLIHIQPSLRLASDKETEFPNVLKKLTSFITSEITLNNYFEIVENAEKARRTITYSVNFIKEIITNKAFPLSTDVNSLIMDKLTSSTAINTLAMTCIACTKSNSEIPSEIEEIVSLMNIIIDLIAKDNDGTYTSYISFFANAAFAVGQAYPKIIIEPVTKLIKICAGENAHFSEKNTQSIISMLTSIFWVISKINDEFAQSECYKNLFNYLADHCGFNKKDPSTIKLFYRSGMETSFNPSVLLNKLSTCAPQEFPSIMSIIGEFLQSSNNCIQLFYSILHEISSICSGGRSSFMSKIPTISQMPLMKADICKTPEITLGGCLELIQIVRRFLVNSDSPTGRTIMEIFVFILNNFSGKATTTSGDYTMFKDPLLLYGVFSVLSNVIDVISFSSLIKETSTSSLYYISGIETNNNIYKCWKLPITGESRLIDIPFSENVVSVSSIPFTPTIFPVYDALIPVFLQFLARKETSPFFNGLSYYVFTSMKEYCTQLSFFNKLVDEQISNVLPDISYDNYDDDFMSILREHLGVNNDGFAEPRNNNVKLYYASPSTIIDTDKFVFNKDTISVDSGVHVFMTGILPQNNSFTITVSRSNGNTSFDAGFYHMSINESNIKCLMYSVRQHIHSIYGIKSKKLIGKEIPKDQITFTYVPDENICKIINQETEQIIHADKLPSSAVCFVIVSYPGTKLNYAIKSTRKHLLTAGNTIFQKKRKNLPLNDISGLNFSVKAQSSIKSLDVKQELQDEYNESECKRFSTTNYDGRSFVLYPKSAKQTTTELITNPQAKPPESMPKYAKFTEKPTDLIHFDPPPDSFFVPVNHTEEMHASVSQPKRSIVVDKFTGKVMIQDKSKNYVSSNVLLLIHPRNFGILPADIINNFAAGYAKKIKKTLLSTIILQCYSPSSIGIQESLVKFNFDESTTLLNNLLSLLASIEPYNLFQENNGSPIDFNINYMDPDVQQPKSSQFLQKNAITNIMKFVDASGKKSEFIERWCRLFIREMYDPTSHSVKKNHPHAVIIDLSTLTKPLIVSRLGVVGWIVLRTECSTDEKEICLITSTHSKIKMTLINKILLVNDSSFTVESKNVSSELKIAAIPIFSKETNTLSGSFLDLIISFKYLIYTIEKSGNDVPYLLKQKMRARIYSVFIDAFIGNSPFFVTYGNDIFRFITKHLPLTGNDISGGVLQRINMLSTYKDRAKYPYIQPYLEEFQAIWDERSYLNLKHYFPYFASESDKIDLAKHAKTEFTLPSFAQLPDKLVKDMNTDKLLILLKRIFLPRENQYGFPFPALIQQWTVYTLQCVPADITYISPTLMKIDFKAYIPDRAKLCFRSNESFNMKYAFSQDMNFAKPLKDMFQTGNHKVVYVQLEGTSTTWELLSPFVSSKDNLSMKDFITKYSDMFVDDIKHFLFNWDRNTDLHILNTFKFSTFISRIVDISIDPITLNKESLRKQLNILCLRAHLLLILNWVYNKDGNKFLSDPSTSHLISYISPKLKLESLRELIRRHSKSRRPSFTINRKEAIEIRDGVSTDLNKTIIAQMVKYYKKPDDFRDSSNKPWEVQFANEQGIDAGGPARELVTELAADACSVNCGLVVQTPNARNDVGQFRDTVIPIPNPAITNSDKRYRFLGALIAICVRTGLVQVFNFPPLVWEFIITGEIAVERIYEIDENYKQLISSFKSAASSGMDDETFKSRFNRKFVVVDTLGKEVPLLQRGRTECVTVSNCSQYISLANTYRINELKTHLTFIRDGFWENVGEKPVATLDWMTLEYAACGEREISFEALKAVTQFEGVPKNQQEIFLRVCEALTSEQRSLLLRFSTGRIRLPPNPQEGEVFLKVDFSDGKDKMPTASTCFHQLHMPSYSSYEKALKLITVAIEFTGSMELR